MFGEKLQLLRRKLNLTQEDLAEILNVSRQSVQRWETDAAVPDMDNIATIGKKFRVSIDWLMEIPIEKDTDWLRMQSIPVPQYDKMGYWEYYSADILVDYQQALDEGKQVAHLRKLVEEISALPVTPEKEELSDILFRMFYQAPERENYHYREPDNLEEILLLRQSCPELPKLSVPEHDAMREKLAGAWMGRVCGCMLGKPVECISCGELLLLLKATDNYPLHRYILKTDITNPMFDSFSFPLKRSTYPDMLTDGFPGDDDINYTIMGAAVIERYGINFTSADMSLLWRQTQTIYDYATAEKVAYKNAMDGYFPPDTAKYKNPFREWIGAQIRGDYFGYICPGDPETAAELAFRDATVSHVKNGIYGEMFVAAMLAGAACLKNITDVVRCGLSQIPATSRLYERISAVLNTYISGKSWDNFIEDFYKRYDEFKKHDAVHVISNCELVCAALLWGNLDYGKTICLAVQPGFDTDCNGATAGSVVGMLLGRSAIPEQWTVPIKDRVHCSIHGYEMITTEQMVTMAMKHIKNQHKD